MRLSSRSAAVVVGSVAVALLVVHAPAASARTDDRSKPVVYVHGYNAWGDADTDCNMWSPMDNTLRSWGLTGTKATVRYYFGDYNCTYEVQHHGSHGTHYGHSGDTHDRYTRIEHLGYHLAWMIYDHFSSKGVTVDVVSHSMGGLITRYALAQVQRGHSAFPPHLYLEDSVTLGTPHAGTGWANWCWTTQCEQMRPGSSFIKWLRSYAWNPQGSGGTDWTVQGSYDDEIVSESSGVDMGAAHKVQYLGSSDVTHGDYYLDTSDARTADVYYQDYGGSWYAWYDAPWSVRWSDYAMVYGSW